MRILRPIVMVGALSLLGCATMQSRWKGALSANTVDSYEQFLSRYPDGDLAAQAKVKVQALHYEQAKSVDSVEAYEQFLARYPEGELASQAKVRLELLHFDQAKSVDRVEAYEQFLARYPEGELAAQAKVRLEPLHFDQAKSADSVEAYQLFVDRYSQGRLSDEARSRIERLHFEEACKVNTPKAYEKFLTKHRKGCLAWEAWRKWETLGFEEARSADTLGAYEDYLVHFPTGAHAAQAKTAAVDLRIARMEGPLRNLKGKSLCVVVEEDFPGERTLPVKEALVTFLSNAGIESVEDPNGSGGTLKVRMAGEGLAATYWGARRIFSGAEVEAKFSLGLQGQPVMDSRGYWWLAPPFSIPMGVDRPSPENAPFDDVWPGALLDGLIGLFGQAALLHWDCGTAEVKGFIDDIKDQEMMGMIAKSARCEEIRLVAVGSLQDQAVLAQIALGDKDTKVRLTALAKVMDQALLAKVAQEEESKDIREAALSMVTAPSLLAQVAREGENSAVCSQAAEKLEDQELLAQIAVENKAAEVRRTAVKRLTDPTVLAGIAKNDKNEGVRDDAVKRLAVMKSTEQALRAGMKVPAGCRAKPGTKADGNAGWAMDIVHEKTGIELVYVPGGSFQMGGQSDSTQWEEPIHSVTLKPLYMGKCEVTNGQYNAFASANGKEPSGCGKWTGSEYPAVCVSWSNAQEFCRWAGLRLPSESEWEYACRAGTTTAYSFGDDVSELGEYAWYVENSGQAPHPVGRRMANPWGLCDMQGNAREWCEDLWHDSYVGAPGNGTAWNVGGDARRRVYRGGAWDDHESLCMPRDRSFYQNGEPVGGVFGFRVVLGLPGM